VPLTSRIKRLPTHQGVLVAVLATSTAIFILRGLLPADAFAAVDPTRTKPDDLANAANAEQVAENAKSLVTTWTKAIFVAAAGVMAIPMLFKREAAAIASLMCGVFVLGILVFSPTTAESIIRGIGDALSNVA